MDVIDLEDEEIDAEVLNSMAVTQVCVRLMAELHGSGSGVFDDWYTPWLMNSVAALQVCCSFTGGPLATSSRVCACSFTAWTYVNVTRRMHMPAFKKKLSDSGQGDLPLGE